MAKIFPIFLILFFAFTGINQSIANTEPDFIKPLKEELKAEHNFQKDKKAFDHKPPMINEHRPPSPEEFERRLNLTEEQKAFAKTQREKSIQKIKPILDEINTKKSEIEILRKNDQNDDNILKIENDIKNLRRQAHEIRRENMKSFEATLTETQKKELQKMKDEGRRNLHEKQKLNNK